MNRTGRTGRWSSDGHLTWKQLGQIGRVPPLSIEEERSLTTEYARTRDLKVAQRIASANLRLVIKLAGTYARRSNWSLADLLQEGCVGLMEAVERFDPQRGVRFASYATWWIRSCLLKGLMDNARLVRAGRSRVDRYRFFHGDGPGAELSLDAPCGSANDGDNLVDVLPAAGESPIQLLEAAEERVLVTRQVAAFGQCLPPREAAVFRQRLLAAKRTPLRELASQFDVSRERIRQIEKGLVSRFRLFAQAA